LSFDNLYEPVNPPPLYGTGSGVLPKRDPLDRGSLPRIDIPAEIEIITSEGLDGLDQPDPHDRGFDGDREWAHSDDEHSQAQKYTFTAGIRNSVKSTASSKEGGESQTSSSRPLTNKPTMAFEAKVKDIEMEGEKGKEMEEDQEGGVGGGEEGEEQEVPTGSQQHLTPTPARKKTTAFAILKGKAADCAGQMKQRFKIALPIRPKLNQWEGVKLARKKPKRKRGESAERGEQQVPEGDEEGTMEEATTEDVGEQPQEMEICAQPPPPEPSAEEIAAEESKSEALKREKEAAAEEKKRKQKEQEEIKKQKAEEKKKEQEELRLKKEKEAEEKKERTGRTSIKKRERSRREKKRTRRN